MKLEYYFNHHPNLHQAPNVAILSEQKELVALKALPLQAIEPEMPPKRDIKQATEENVRQRKIEVARRRAEECKAEQKKVKELKAKEKKAEESKAAEKKVAELEIKIKEENIERNKRDKGVSIEEPNGVSKKTSQVEGEDRQMKKKYKVDSSLDLMILDPPSSDTVLLTTKEDAPRTSQMPPPPPSQQKRVTTGEEATSSQIPLLIVFSRNPVRDSAPRTPQILISSLELPSGHPFTI